MVKLENKVLHAFDLLFDRLRLRQRVDAAVERGLGLGALVVQKPGESDGAGGAVGEVVGVAPGLSGVEVCRAPVLVVPLLIVAVEEQVAVIVAQVVKLALAGAGSQKALTRAAVAILAQTLVISHLARLFAWVRDLGQSHFLGSLKEGGLAGSGLQQFPAARRENGLPALAGASFGLLLARQLALKRGAVISALLPSGTAPANARLEEVLDVADLAVRLATQ